MPDVLASRCDPAVLRLVADYWTLRIVETLAIEGGLRFTAIARELGGVSPVTLSNRLRQLTRSGVLDRTVGERGTASVHYALSARGRLLVPMLDAARAFQHAG